MGDVPVDNMLPIPEEDLEHVTFEYQFPYI